MMLRYHLPVCVCVCLLCLYHPPLSPFGCHDSSSSPFVISPLGIIAAIGGKFDLLRFYRTWLAEQHHVSLSNSSEERDFC